MVKVIFEDDQILVFDKPPGLVVDNSETQQDSTLQTYLAQNYPSNLDRMGIVHRLDKDTSGVIIVAKTQQALENLQAQFKERKTKKEYLALVHGEVKGKGVIEGSIGRNPGNREKFVVLDDGKEAVTEYEPIQSLVMSADFLEKTYSDFSKIQNRKLNALHYSQFTLLSCKPLTGRTHQIRVHLKHIGFPIVSDEKYVGRKICRLDRRWCVRIFLHAARLGFYHPKTGEWMEIESPLPKDLKEVLWTAFSYNLQ